MLVNTFTRKPDRTGKSSPSRRVICSVSTSSLCRRLPGAVLLRSSFFNYVCGDDDFISIRKLTKIRPGVLGRLEHAPGLAVHPEKT